MTKRYGYMSPTGALITNMVNNNGLDWMYRAADGACTYFKSRDEAYRALYEDEGYPAEQPEDNRQALYDGTPEARASAALAEMDRLHQMEMDCDDRRIGPTDDDTTDSRGEGLLSRRNEAGEWRW